MRLQRFAFLVAKLLAILQCTSLMQLHTQLPRVLSYVMFSYIINFDFSRIPPDGWHKVNFRHIEKWNLTKLSQKPFGIIDYHWRNDVQLIFHLDYAHIRALAAFSNLGTFFGPWNF